MQANLDSLVKSWEPNKITILLKQLELEKVMQKEMVQVLMKEKAVKNQVLKQEVALALTSILTG
jgi:hypothetical protein